MTRISWKKPNAIAALKIGTDAWMIDASPESIRVSPQESSQNGTAVLTSADDGEPAPVRAQLAERLAPPTEPSATTSRASSAAVPSRPMISVAGARSRTADLDEHERRAPDQRERGEHDEMAAAAHDPF